MKKEQLTKITRLSPTTHNALSAITKCTGDTMDTTIAKAIQPPFENKDIAKKI